MATSTKLNLVLKGDRDYVTGADIFQALARETDAMTDLSLRFHRLTDHEIEMVEVSKAEPIGDVEGMFLYNDAAGNPRRLLLRALGQPILARVPYREELAVSDAVINGSTIRSQEAQGFSFIERAIALNKLLLTKLCATDKSIKWIFTRIDLSEYPRMPMPAISLTASSIANPRLIRSELRLDDRSYGHVWFSGVRRHD
jgi:hypothetical protein